MLSKHKNYIRFPLPTSVPPYTYTNNEQFIFDLCRFRGISKQSYVCPYLNGQPVDLIALYNEVVSRGGSKRVTSSSQWDSVAQSLSMTSRCVNIGHALKCLFHNHLGKFEMMQRSIDGQTFNDHQSSHAECDTSDSVINLQLFENHLRERWNLSVDIIEPSEYRALVLALSSGLPNELDYAINTILLMSSQPCGFELYRCPQLLPLLLSTVGIFTEDPDSYKCLTNSWNSQCFRDFSGFWNNIVCHKFGRTFLNSKKFIDGEPLLDAPSIPRVNSSFRHSMSYYDVEGFRAQLIAMVLRNMVVNFTTNSVLLSQSHCVLRFIFLCIYSSHNVLRELGLDILSFLTFPVVGILVPIIRHLLSDLLSSPDRVDIARGLRIFRNLCQSPLKSCQKHPSTHHELNDSYIIASSSRNIEFLASLPSSMYATLMRLMYLRDLHILVLALDAVLALSSLGPNLCKLLLELCDNETILLGTLIAHQTFEPQSFGSESLIRMRVMQVPGFSHPAAIQTTTMPTSYSTFPLNCDSKKQLVSDILLAPSPLPPAGCFAVPVSFSTATKDTPVKCITTDSRKSTPSADFSSPSLVKKVTLISCASTMSNVDRTPIHCSATVSATGLPILCSTVLQTSSCGVRTSTVTTNAKLSSLPAVLSNQPILFPANGKHHLNMATVNRSNEEHRNVKNTSSSEPPYLDAPTNKREFAVFWLLKNFRVNPQSSFPRVQIYVEYQKAYQQQFGVGGAFSAGEFHNIIRSTFPSVDQVKVLVPNGNVEIHYNKLKHVDAPDPLEHNLGVHHMIAPFLLGQHEDGINSVNSSQKSISNSKNPKKRNSSLLINNHVQQTDQMCLSIKQTRLNEDLLTNGISATRSISPIVNGPSVKFVLPETTVPNGTIELSNNIGFFQPAVIAASAVVLQGIDGVPRQLNGPMGNCAFSNQLITQIALPYQQQQLHSASHLTPGSLPPTSSSSSSPFYQTQNNLVDPALLQFRTLLPSNNACSIAPRSSTIAASVSTLTNISTFPPRQSPRQPMLIQSSQPTLVSSQHSSAQTLTCLGTLVTTTSNNNANHQVYVYSLTSPPLIPLSLPHGVSQQSTANPVLVSLPSPFVTASSTQLPTLTDSSGSSSFSCLWDSCAKTFNTSDQLFSHVYAIHFLPIRGHDSNCKWISCRDNGLRPPLSLLNHLHEHHCTKSLVSSICNPDPVLLSKPPSATANNPPLYQHRVSRQPLTKSTITQTTTPTSGSVYSSGIEASVASSITHATLTTVASRSVPTSDCFRIIVNDDFINSAHEGPVTKHIRLTAALILHNFSLFSSSARHHLVKFEPILCDLIFAGTEASSTLAKCLSLLSAVEPPQPLEGASILSRCEHIYVTGDLVTAASDHSVEPS